MSRIAGALLVLVACSAARAQWDGTITALSDHRFRGVSLSDERPGLQLAANYDAPGGWYLGASGTRVAVGAGRRYTEVSAYAGLVVERTRSPSWEVGAVGSHFVGDSTHDYAEVYGGLIGERWNTRLYLSPDYFGRGVATAYLEGNATLPLGETLRLLGHAGLLAGHGGGPGSDAGTARVDLRLGIGIARRGLDLQLAWAAASRGGPYPAVYDARRSAWLASASLSF